MADFLKYRTYFAVGGLDKVLQEKRQHLLDAKASKGKPIPTDISSNDLVTFFMEHHLDAGTRSVLCQYSFETTPYEPCRKPVAELRKIEICQLRSSTHHRGSFLVLRLISPVDETRSLLAVAEDEDERAILIQIFNPPGMLANRQIEMFSPIIIKEPLVQLVAWGEMGIRVDHPSDLICLSRYDENLPLQWKRGKPGRNNKLIEKWKLEGNKLYKAGHYVHSIDCYSKALEMASSRSEGQMLRFNRAQAFCKLGKLDAVVLELENISAEMQPYEDALYRKSRALYDLRRFRESSDLVDFCCKKYPNNVRTRKLLKDTINRCVEERSGRYPFKEMQDNVEKGIPRLEHATYIGKVEVRQTKSKGRGLFTTAKVKAGDLLLCEKAFGYIHSLQDAHGNNVYSHGYWLGLDCARAIPTARMELALQVIRELGCRPSSIAQLMDLHAGHYASAASSYQGRGERPIIDSFLVHQIVSLNMLVSHVSTRDFQMRRIESGMHLEDESEFAEAHRGPCGLWRLASYANHSCEFNAQHSFIGDMIILRASKDLPPDMEITIRYREHNNDYSKVNHFKDRGFSCTCDICRSIASTSDATLAKRATLVKETRAFIHNPKKRNPEQVREKIIALQKTYSKPAIAVPRFSLLEVKFALAQIFDKGHLPINAAEVAFECFQICGYLISGGNIEEPMPTTETGPILIRRWGMMDFKLVQCWMILSRSYRIKAPSLVAPARKYAKLFYRICVGEDETFSETLG